MAGGHIAIMIHAKDLVEAILAAADRWIVSSHGSDPFQKNYDRFMHRKSNGFPPLVVGIPVIT